MSIYQKLRSASNEFLRDLKINDNHQSFVIGMVCGYFLQNNSDCSIIALKDQIKAVQEMITNGLVKGNYFDDFVQSLISNLEKPRNYNFQQQECDGGTPVLQNEDYDQKQKYQYEDPNEEATMALIKKLQEEDQKFAQKKQIEVEQVDCPICFSNLMEEDVIPLESCVHIFHINCLKELLLQCIKDKRNQITCPEQKCGKDIAINDISHIIGKEKKDEFLNYTLNKFVDDHAADMSWCPTPDCQYAFVLGDEDDNNQFECPLCKKSYCLNCRVTFHKGQTCKEYSITNTRDQNDEKFEKFVKGHKFKMCTKCKFWVEKNQGCNHMTCRCGYQFCYVCGGKYLQCECVEKQKQQQQEFLRQSQLAIQQQKQLQKQQKKSSKGRR
ncbi:unnamed protein product [Paramecium primaurelia]|uniref:IBR domain protein n=1 Tax=Paramecium primaurelia TaxID=5886 RepID=A0A8S1KYT1_PARPR|nr:unnamed protein product [Paramecium primaurelia]